MVINDQTPQWIQIAGGSDDWCPVAPSAVGTTAELELAQTDSWTRSIQGTAQGLNLIAITRMAYSHGGDEILYGYYRTWTFNKCGQLASVSAETRITIDTPEPCSTI